MLAKVIGYAPTREQALAITASALRRSAIHGVVTNRDLLVRVLDDPDFVSGDFATDFLTGDRLTRLAAPLLDANEIAAATAAAAAVLDRREAALSPLPHVVPGWRNLGSRSAARKFDVAGTRVDATGTDAVTVLRDDGRTAQVAVERDGVRRTLTVTSYPGDTTSIEIDSARGAVGLTLIDPLPSGDAAAAAGSLMAPMPGVITRIGAAVGESVAAGQPVLWMEAMKMEHAINAPADGVLATLAVEVGQNIEAGALVAVLEDGGAGENADNSYTSETEEQQ